MKKKGSIIYVTLCLLICILPFAGMVVMPTNTTTENKTMVQFPTIKEEGKWNIEWLSKAGAYFEEHFAFRPYLVTMDSKIQTGIFGVSAMENVTAGTDGWLYYSATLKDFLGQDLLSQRECYNISHNLFLMEKFVKEKGASFLFTVPPNKNTLYGEHMPYYNQKKISDETNMSRLTPWIKQNKISYVDLFNLFKQEKEVLYLKRDSHWNQKGAVLVSNALFDALEKEHETYETVRSIRTKTEYGDLNRMVYPKWEEREWNYAYDYEDQFSYITDTKTVEDAWIETKNNAKTGNLLMFRDSFGNTLLPLMANEFQTGCFSKGVPYQVETLMDQFHPDTVIAEKVERNIRDFAQEPPVFTGPVVEIESKAEKRETKTTLFIEESEYDSNYWKIAGCLDSEYVKDKTNVYIKIDDGKNPTIYEAFTTTNTSGEEGYVLYLRKMKLTKAKVHVCVFMKNGDQLLEVKNETEITIQ